MQPQRLTSDDLERVEAMVDFVPLAEALRAAAATLSDRQFEAVRLRVATGLSYADVASALGCTEGAARVRVSRGLARLAVLMGERS